MQWINVTTDVLGRNAIFYKEIDSTQSEIWRRLKKGELPNGTLIMADKQTKGKGTHGRIWHTDEENNIAFSFYLETDCPIQKLEGITIEIAKILVEILKEMYHITLTIKVPNDITYQNKKIGGILTESKIQAETVKYLVVGIGMNTNQMNFSEEIKNTATSIKKEFGIEIDRTKVITSFCQQFEETIKRRRKE